MVARPARRATDLPRCRPGGPQSAARIGLVALLTCASCAPREADFAASERTRAAPPPELIATELFETPRQRGAADIPRRQAEVDALAVRAEALRGRGAALSGAPVLAPAAVDRLTGGAAD